MWKSKNYIDAFELISNKGKTNRLLKVNIIITKIILKNFYYLKLWFFIRSNRTNKLNNLKISFRFLIDN